MSGRHRRSVAERRGEWYTVLNDDGTAMSWVRLCAGVRLYGHVAGPGPHMLSTTKALTPPEREAMLAAWDEMHQHPEHELLEHMLRWPEFPSLL